MINKLHLSIFLRKLKTEAEKVYQNFNLQCKDSLHFPEPQIPNIMQQ